MLAGQEQLPVRRKTVEDRPAIAVDDGSERVHEGVDQLVLGRDGIHTVGDRRGEQTQLENKGQACAGGLAGRRGTTETIRVTPSVKTIWTSTSSGTHTEVALGASGSMMNSPTRTRRATVESTPATAMLDIGKTSRGQ